MIAIFQRRGFGSDWAFNPTLGPVCLEGAISVVTHHYGETGKVMDLPVYRALVDQSGADVLARWYDGLQLRRKREWEQEVIDLLVETARKYEAIAYGPLEEPYKQVPLWSESHRMGQISTPGKEGERKHIELDPMKEPAPAEPVREPVKEPAQPEPAPA